MIRGRGVTPRYRNLLKLSDKIKRCIRLVGTSAEAVTGAGADQPARPSAGGVTLRYRPGATVTTPPGRRDRRALITASASLLRKPCAHTRAAAAPSLTSPGAASWPRRRST